MEIDEKPAVTAEEMRNGDFAAAITDAVNAQLPEEKARAEREMDETAKAVAADPDAHGWVEGLGQPLASIPPIIHHRWHQLYPGCWKDRAFVDEFLADNPRCQLPGYKPKAKTMYFDMGGKQPFSFGASIYHQFKDKVSEQAKSDARAMKRMGLVV